MTPVLENFGIDRSALLGSAAQNNAPIQNITDYNDIVYAENVTDLFETSPNVLAYSNNGATVNLSSNIFEETPERGDIIVLPPDLHYPGGRAVRVTSVNTAGNNLRLQVEEPELEEVFETLDFNTTFTPDVERIVELFNARQAAGIGNPEFDYISSIRGAASNNLPRYFNSYSNLPIASAPEQIFKLTVGTDGSVELTVTAFRFGSGDNNVTINGKFKFEFGKIHAEYNGSTSWTNWASVDVNVPVTVTSEISVKGQLRTQLQIPLAIIPLPSPVPGLYGEIDLYFTIGVTGTIEVGITQKTQISYGLQGVLLPTQRITPILNVTDFPFPTLKLNLEASGKAVFQLKTSIKIVGMDMISVTPEYGLGITAKLEPFSECQNVHITVHHLLQLEGTFGPWKGEIKFLDEKNSPGWDFYFDVDTFSFNSGKCPHVNDNTIGNIINNGESLERLIGTYRGSYVAQDGYLWDITLNVFKNANGTVEAIVDCIWDTSDNATRPRQSGPGSWRSTVNYDLSSNTYSILFSNWIRNPGWDRDSYIDCTLSNDGNTLSGIVNASTWSNPVTFTFYRINRTTNGLIFNYWQPIDQRGAIHFDKWRHSQHTGDFLDKNGNSFIGVGMHESNGRSGTSYVKYNIPASSKKFTTYISLDSVWCGTSAYGTSTFQVLFDDELVFSKSYSETFTAEFVELQIPQNAKTITLQIQQNALWSGNHACFFGEPTFLP